MLRIDMSHNDGNGIEGESLTADEFNIYSDSSNGQLSARSFPYGKIPLRMTNSHIYWSN